MSDRERLDKALASAVDEVQNGNICCGGCYPVTGTTFAYYTTQDVERSFSEDGDKPYGDRIRYSSYEDEDEGGEREYPDPFAPDANILVGPLHIGYGLRDGKVWTAAKCTRVRKAIVEALNAAGFTAADPGSNDQRIEVTAVTDTRSLAR